MTASNPGPLTFDVFRGVPVAAMVTAAGATVAPVIAFAAAATDQGLPGGLAISAAGLITGTPTGAVSTHFGSGFPAGVTGEGSYQVTLNDTGNSITGIVVNFRVHDDLPADETDTAVDAPVTEVNRENMYNQETGA